MYPAITSDFYNSPSFLLPTFVQQIIHAMIDKMIENMPKNTGKTLEEWVHILNNKREAASKHKELVTWLQKEHGLGLNYADIIVHKANGTDSGSNDPEALIQKQYEGKEHLKPIYDLLLQKIQSFGEDIEVAPKNAYVSLKRKKQFACLKPATKTRFELELILKGQTPEGILEPISGAGAMCTHKIRLENIDQVSEEVIGWAQKAYEKAAG